MELTFEAALKRLEEVVDAMEADDTTLEASIAFYKEGVTLSEHCDKILKRIESEIVVLDKDNM